MTERIRPLALVTGGAHRLGRAIAIGLAQKGYAIFLHYFRAQDEAYQTASELEALGTEVFIRQADLTEENALVSLFSEIDALHHPFQVLINSAAVMCRGDVRELNFADWNATMDLNLWVPLRCSQEAARKMEKGLIVNVTDMGTQKTWSGFPSYAVSKSALESLTRVLARSLAPNIRVNAVAPGFVIPSQDVSAENWARLIKRVPLERPARPEEIASAVGFLVDNEYITGQTIVVDGGYSLVG